MQKRTRYARALMMPFLILCVLLCGLFINENTAFRDPAEEKAAHPAALPYIGDEMEGGDRPGDGRIHFQRRCCLPIYEPDDTGNLWLSAISGKWPYLCIGFLLILVAAASVVIFFFGKFCLPHDAEIVAAGAFSAFGSLAVLSSALGVWLITRPHLPAAENGSGPLGILHDLSLALLPTGLFSTVTCLYHGRIRRLAALLTQAAKILLMAELLLFLLGICDLSSLRNLIQGQCIAAFFIAGSLLLFSPKSFSIDKHGADLGIVLSLVLGILVAYLYSIGTAWLPVVCLAVLILLVTFFVNSMIRLQRLFLTEMKTRDYRTYALTDPLTKLGSRFAYEEFCAGEEASSPALAIVIIDLNGLKTINDRRGHTAGDEALCGAADCIRSVFGDIGHCFRMGGDEFMIALQADEDALQRFLSELEEKVDSWQGKEVKNISLSCGFALRRKYPDADIETLMRYADKMMYQKKAEYYRA